MRCTNRLLLLLLLCLASKARSKSDFVVDSGRSHFLAADQECVSLQPAKGTSIVSWLLNVHLSDVFLSEFLCMSALTLMNF